MNINDQTILAAQAEFDYNLEIVREIYERWPSVRVKFLDPDKLPDLTDKPFILTELCSDGKERIIFSCDRLDRRVIDYLHSIDQEYNDIQAKMLKAEQDKALSEASKEAEKREAATDLIAVGVKHFNSGKLKFRYTNEHGEKRVVG